MSQFAPVFIPTLCRYDHLKRCIESLSRCTHADKTDLIVALDYPLKESHWEGYRKIDKYLETVVGFHSVAVIKREQNYGAIRNYTETQKEIFEKYDRAISSEDDNEFSPNFLDYINEGLDRFESDSRIFAVCGYNYPVKMPDRYAANFYIWKGFSAWGYGIWRERHNRFIDNFSYDYVARFLSSVSHVHRLTHYADHYLPAMLEICKTGYVTGDTVLCSMLILEEAYCVFPLISKVRNYGHDGTGANCGFMSKDIYSSQELDSATSFSYDPVPTQENDLINSVLRSHFGLSYKSRCKTLLKYLLFRLKNEMRVP